MTIINGVPDENNIIFKAISDNEKIIVTKEDDSVGILIDSKVSKKLIKEVIEEISDRINYKTEIKAFVSLKVESFPKIVKNLLIYGFENPGVKLDKEPFLILSKLNGIIEKTYYNLKEFENVNALLENFDSWIESGMKKSLPCSLTVQIIPSSVRNLMKMVNVYKFTDEEKVVNKEFSGIFSVTEITPRSGDYIYNLEIDPEHVSVGGNNSVNGVDKCFTFHTHPKSEYDSIEVTSAWPSITDIETVIDLLVHNSGVLHVLAGVEGIYYISVNSSWANRLEELSEKMKDDIDSLTKYYQIPYPEKGQKNGILTPEQYVKKVSKNTAPLQIQFRKWEDTTPVQLSTTRIFGDNNTMFCKCDL